MYKEKLSNKHARFAAFGIRNTRVQHMPCVRAPYAARHNSNAYGRENPIYKYGFYTCTDCFFAVLLCM